LPCSNSDFENKITKKTTPNGKIESAKRALTKQPNKKVKRRLVYKKDDNSSECEVLREEIEDLKEKLKVKTEQVNEMFDELSSLKAEKCAQSKQKSSFFYACLKLYPQQFLYMTGLS